jgi:hypothetical protein
MANPTPQNRGIQVTLSPGLQNLIRTGPRAIIAPAVARALDLQNEYTIGAAVQRRLSYSRNGRPQPDGLRVQSGRLRRSLNRSPARVEGGYVIGGIGSNVQYFGVHEFGWEGTQSVPAHTRQLKDRYRLTGMPKTITAADAKRAGLTTKKGTLRKGLGETVPGREVKVKAHQRYMRFPARRMVRLTVTERIPAYTASIASEIQRALTAGT